MKNECILRRVGVGLAAVLLVLITGCGEPTITRLQIYTTEDQADLLTSFTSFIPWEDLEVIPSDDPAADASGGRKVMRVAVVPDLDCTECYRIEGEGRSYTVHGDAPLGIQYGLAHLMELWGFRFHHPWDTMVPESLEPLDGHGDLGVTFEPQMRVRGIQMHTLHPVEALWAVWLDDGDAPERMARIVDWLIKNRGNYVQWVGLDDIIDNNLRWEQWHAHTTAIVDDAHARGVGVGLNLQVFGSGNLQQCFDLIDGDLTPEQQRAAIEERMALLAGIDWDLFALSFGEFFGEEPQVFIDAVNRTVEEMRAVQPDVDFGAKIHVGNYEDLYVEYQGETVQYYFLVQFADEAIVPWIHTVMYYNLFEDAGGAYLHDEFDEHREFLLQRLTDEERVVYFPESAYWCAFDNPVPTYLPLYVLSRWLDIDRIRQAADAGGYAALDEHVLFTSGWEWGYWQNDVATLRSNYRMADSWETEVRWMFQPYGDAGAALSEQIIALANLQHELLMEERLAAYMAGRDAFMDAGAAVGIVSMPDRVTLEDLAAMEPGERASFRSETLTTLEKLAQDTWAIDAQVQQLAKDNDNPWFDEVADGTHINALRAEFSHALYEAVAHHADDGDDAGFLAEADDLLAQAHETVDRRHASMHDPEPERLISEGTNPTVYQYGYLKHADELCFWHRERLQAARIIEGSTEVPPGCAW